MNPAVWIVALVLGSLGSACTRAPTPIEISPRAEFRLLLPDGWKINDEAPTRLGIWQTGAAGAALKEFSRAELALGVVSLPTLEEGQEYRLEAAFYYCEKKDSKVCLRKDYRQQVRARGGAKGVLEVRLE